MINKEYLDFLQRQQEYHTFMGEDERALDFACAIHMYKKMEAEKEGVFSKGMLVTYEGNEVGFKRFVGKHGQIAADKGKYVIVKYLNGDFRLFPKEDVIPL